MIVCLEYLIPLLWIFLTSSCGIRDGVPSDEHGARDGSDGGDDHSVRGDGDHGGVDFLHLFHIRT